MASEAISAANVGGALHYSPAILVAGRPTSQTRRHRVTDPSLVRAARRAGAPFKTVFDILVTTLALVFLAPIMVSLAVAIWLSDGELPLIGHERAGRHAKPFRCWKFRTRRRETGARTAIGSVLLATGLDGLPQLFNVLFGDMSLVGPQPLSKRKLNERYGKHRCYYLLLRPGIVGLWQTASLSQLQPGPRIALDRKYVYEWSLVGDIKIMLRAASMALSGAKTAAK